MKRSTLLSLAVVAALSAFAPSARADFPSCIGSLRAAAAHAGISAHTLDVAFNGLTPDVKVLDFQKQQPEFKTPVWDYVGGLADDDRVVDGKAAMAREGRALARAEEKDGVSRYILAAIWGVELNFGQEMGKRSLVQSLTTLACMGDRANYFRSELMATLKIIDRGDVPPEKLNGSWAGAFGQTQFMPSTFLRLAVDFEGDGRRDIVDWPPTRWRRRRTISPSQAGARGSPGASRSSCPRAIRARRGAGPSSPCPSGQREGSLASTGVHLARATPRC